MGFRINSCVWSNMFALPAQITDKHLKMANETQIKTILWIFRHTNESIDAKIIAKSIGKPAPAVEEALFYWASVRIIDSEAFVPLAAEEKSASTAVKKELAPIPETMPSYEQIKKRCKESPELEMLFNEVQKKLGKTIGYDGEYSLLMMHDSYGLPVEVIFMLVDYCVSVGKSSYSYMRKVAKNWGEREIDSIEKADEIISNLNTCQRVWAQLSKMTGLQNPKPTASQSAYLLTWVNEYKFSIDMIYLAYEAMANNCARTSFSYMDAVLKNWYTNGIKNPEDAEKQTFSREKAKTPQKNKKGETKSSYDMDEFERRADALPVYKRKKRDEK